LRTGAIALWTLAILVVVDAIAGIVFRPPRDPRQMSSLQLYFDYGRSIEGKLRNEVGASSAQDALVVAAGWIPEKCSDASPTSPDRHAFDIYGMSFSNYIGERLVQLDPTLMMRPYAGPSAPINHSYACFARRVDSKVKLAPIQILGVLASSIPRMVTVSGLTTSFEAIEPFTYPRYSLTADGRLVAFTPSISSPDELRAALADPAKWHRFTNELAIHDFFYDRFVFNADLFDYSVLGRMVRRAWGQRIQREGLAQLRRDDFTNSPDIVPVLRAMLIDFANKARSVNARPIVILIEDRGFGRTLSTIAAPALKANHIDFIATSDIVSPEAADNFIPDGHFTPAANDKIAEAVLSLLRREPIR
jgi:hypothetical protein